MDTDGTEIHDSKTVNDQTMASTVTEYAESIPGYIADKAQKQLTLGAEGNVITFVYRARVTVENYTGVYDGKEHTITVKNLLEGDTIEYSYDNGVTFESELRSYKDVVDGQGIVVRVTNENYSQTEQILNGIVTITPFNMVVKADNQVKIYGAADPEFTATVSVKDEGTVKPDDGYNITYDGEFVRQPGEDAGSYTIFASGNYNQGNYRVTFENGTLEIKKAERPTGEGFDITVNPYEGVYDAKAHTITVNNLLDGDQVQYSYDEGATWEDELREFTDVINLPIKVKVTNPNYTPEVIELDSYVIITPKSVTVTADSGNKAYGTADPELGASVEGTLNGDTIEYTVSREPGEYVGDYVVTATGETAQGNYTVIYQSGIFTITKADRTMAVNVKNYRGEYDADDHTIQVNNTVDGDVLEYSYDGGETWVSDLKTYTDVTNEVVQIFVRVTNSNYEPVEDLLGTVYIWPKAVQVTAQDNGKVYGESDPKLTATVSGVIEGQESLIQYSVTRAEGEDVGTYPIWARGEAAQGNYQVSYVDAVFTITAAARAKEITAESYTGVYDGEEHTITVKNLEAGDQVEYSYDNGLSWEKELRNYTDVTPGQGIIVRVTNTNYAPSVVYADGTVTIMPFEMVVTADDKVKTYGDADPEFTAVVSVKNEGTVKPDDGYDITYDSEFIRQPGEDAGIYTIYAGGSTKQGNYLVTYVNGTLTINKAQRPTEGDFAVAVEPYEGIYDSNAHTITVKNLLEGDEVQYSYDGKETWTNELREYTDVTALPIHVKVTNSNYEQDEIILDGYVIIKQRPVTVTADSKSKIYGTADPELTATISGTLNGDTVEYTLRRNPGETAGNYDIIADGAASQGNYRVGYQPGVLTILPADREQAITVTNYIGVYDAEAHTIEVKGLEAGDQVQYSYDNGETWVDELRSYTDVTADPVVIYVKVTNPNYEEVEPLVGTVYITPVTVTVTAQNSGKLYGTADPVLEAVVTGVLAGEEELIQYTVTRGEGETVGTYPIWVRGEAVQGNYQVSYVNAEFVIRGTVVYDGNGNTAGTAPIDTGSYYTGDQITVLDKADLVRENAVFLGWSQEKLPLVTTAEEEAAAAIILPESAIAMEEKGITLYAVWALDANGPDGKPDEIPDYEEFSVTYHANGGEGTMEDGRLYPEGYEYAVKDNQFIRANFAFEDWNTAADGTGNALQPGQKLTLTADVNLYAQWAKDETGETDPDVPDGIPDKYQITFTYVSADDEKGTVTGTVKEVHTIYEFTKNEDGSITVGEIQPVSPNADVTVTPAADYAFDYWTIDGSQKDFSQAMTQLKGETYVEDVTFTAYFAEDTKGGTDPADPDDNVPDDPDGIPDKYQTIFQYVSGGNGTVSGTTYEVHTFVEDGVYTEASRMPVKPNADVTVSPNTNYRFSNWTFGDQTYADTDAIAAAEFTADATFTANFVRRSTGGGGGGGGGSTSGGGASSVIRTDGTGTVTINPDDVPLAPLPDDGQSVVTEIPEEEVPLFGLPKTGDNSIPVGGLVGMMLASLLGAFGISRKRKGEDEA